MKVRKRKLTRWERLYLPAVIRGLALTFRHLFRRKVTLRYPEEKHPLPDGYRGLPALVRDQTGRTKCVACYLCEWICPPKAIRIKAREIETHVEKGPEEFEIDFLRCIMCGYCEEVCPEQAIFLTGHYELLGTSRAEMVYDMEKLLKLGGIHHDRIRKWDRAMGAPGVAGGAAARGHGTRLPMLPRPDAGVP
jgi:NADH-quinone oxidoreductase subunit I